MRLPRSTVALLAGVLVCGASASCAKRQPEVVAVVTTDLSVPKDIDALHVDLWGDGAVNPFFSRDFPLQASSLPGTVGVVVGPHTTQPVTIRVSGLLQGFMRVSREAIVTLPTDRVTMLPMPLDWLCMGVPCPYGETCQAGRCVSDVDTPVLEDYLPLPADGGADGGRACFDTSACFAPAVLWEKPFGADCSLPKPPGADVNVALVVVGGDGTCSREGCLVPLDAESVEGWQPSPDGTRIDLPPAVCTNSAVGIVEVSTACPAKPANAAICPGVRPIATSGCVADTDGGCPDGVCESSAGRDQCAPNDSGTTPIQPTCSPDPAVICAGDATGYSCKPGDPLLQCDQTQDSNVCHISGWCCVPAGDAATCPADAGVGAVLIDDMSGQTTGSCVAAQSKLRLPAGQTNGYWSTDDDRTGIGSRVPPPDTAFTYTPVTATCSAPFSNAACMKSVTPYLSPNAYAVMRVGFAIQQSPDGNSWTPLPYAVSQYRGIHFWAKAADTGSKSVTIQVSDGPNDVDEPGAACNDVVPSRCGNFFQVRKAFTNTWTPYEVDFDMLSQPLDADAGYPPMNFDQTAALAVLFVMDGASPLEFDVCVADLYFVPK